MSKGYDSYTDTTSILSYHFTCQEKFIPLRHDAVVGIFKAFRVYYGIHFKEEGAKVE